MQILEHEKAVDIVDILYIKLMRLKNSYRAMGELLFDGSIDAHFPDITAGLKYSFAIDAYSTISALFQSGTYSFNELTKYSDDFKTECDNTWKNICEVLPGLKKRRNKMICHLEEKQDESLLDEMVFRFDSIHQELCDLHKKAMTNYGIKENEIRVMTSEKFEKLDEEYHHFRAVLITGVLEELLKCNMNNDDYYKHS